MINPMSLSGKRILVTGASSGIGRVTAKRVSELGGTVVLVARNEARLQETLASLTGEGHAVYAADLSDLMSIEPLMKRIVAEGGPLDGLVHCAGIAPIRPLALTKPDFLHEVMDVNFGAFVELCRGYVRKGSNRGGSIVVMSSASAQAGVRSKLAYSASKGAIDAAVRVLAEELAPKGIRVNAVVGGFFATEMAMSFADTACDDALANEVSKQPLGIGSPEDAANALCYLLSDAARFITGTGMVVDGGYLA